MLKEQLYGHCYAESAAVAQDRVFALRAGHRDAPAHFPTAGTEVMITNAQTGGAVCVPTSSLRNDASDLLWYGSEDASIGREFLRERTGRLRSIHCAI